MKIEDVKISGKGTIKGGQYRDIHISGSGTINGDVKAEGLFVSGSAQVNGNLNADNIKISGSSLFNGNITAKKLLNSGKVTVKKNMVINDITNKGTLIANDKLKTNSIKSNGSIHCLSNVETEDFIINGGCQIKELLNANTVKIKFGWSCSVKEIGGNVIEILNEKNRVFSLFASLIGKKNRFETNLIEGNDINIEYTNAKQVSGKNVVIGPKCVIEKVEYEKNIQIDNSAIVKNTVKI